MSLISPTVIAVDGPGGSGKGTLCAMLAQHLGWHLLDSGALYRLTAYAANKHGIALDDEVALKEVALNLDVVFEPIAGGLKIILEGEEVGPQLRTEETGTMASKVAALPAVRDGLFQRQRDFAKAPGLVADGRDMGTVVFTDAPLKIFLTASAEERARRRFEQLRSKGIDASLSRLLEEINARDERDTQRAVAPLIPADDSVILDSTQLTIEEVFARVLQLMQERGLS